MYSFFKITLDVFLCLSVLSKNRFAIVCLWYSLYA